MSREKLIYIASPYALLQNTGRVIYGYCCLSLKMVRNDCID